MAEEYYAIQGAVSSMEVRTLGAGLPVWRSLPTEECRLAEVR